MRSGQKKHGKKQDIKQDVKELRTAVSNLQMGLRISQMVSQQQLQNVSRIDSDMEKIFGMSQNLDYRTRALLEILGTDTDKLKEVADRMRLEDFYEKSDEENKQKNYTPNTDGVVGENSVVILTSTVDGDAGKGILRTKFHVDDSFQPSLREKLIGLKVGEKITEKVYNVEHEFELLDILEAPEKPKESENQEDETADAISQADVTEELEEKSE